DARDFDDAVAARPEGDGFRLWVSIADVSHYVKPGSALDRSAAERGTSVYFPHRAVPMLPERLSNDLCSLRPNVLRFAMTCEMRVRPGGRRQGIRIYPSLIQSHGRLTYEQVQAALDGKPPRALSDHVRHLGHLLDVARLLRAHRTSRGAIDLDVAEAQVLLGPDGAARDIKPRERLESHRLIEDLMIAANESAAEHLLARSWPTVFRVHPQPDAKRVAGLAMWAQRAGLDFDFDGKASAKVLARFAESLRRGSRGLAGQMMLLRSLAQARYRDENVGHYALASKAYVHFTSPIRRYPDLLVHRSLRALGRKGSRPRGLGAAAERASLQERRAMEAERAVEQLMACQVASQHLGRTVNGTVVGVHRAGAFVRGVELYVEGLLATEDLESATRDSWDLLDDEQALLARRTGRRIRLGDSVEVRLATVDLRRRYINFELIELPRDDSPRPATSRRRKASEPTAKKKRGARRERTRRSPRSHR
ncbi:MAG: VacB/RNase II family 3'-5' exoribonuclease, partial [Myxococcota bacterium]